MPDYKKYLDPAVTSKLSRLDLVARLVVEGFITGLHKSPYHGFSVEFSEYRQYMPGDSLRTASKSGHPDFNPTSDCPHNTYTAESQAQTRHTSGVKARKKRRMKDPFTLKTHRTAHI